MKGLSLCLKLERPPAANLCRNYLRWRQRRGECALEFLDTNDADAVKARSDGSQAVLEAGSFSWKTDLATSLGGSDAAPSPTALLLSALAGCAVVFIRDTLAPEFGVHLESLEATAECETDSRGLLGMGGALPDLQNIRLSIVVQSADKEEKVRELCQIWQQRCPIYLALTKPLSVMCHFEIASVPAARQG